MLSPTVEEVLACGGIERREKLIALFATMTLTQVLWFVAGAVPESHLLATVLSVLTFSWLFLPTKQRGCSASAKENLFRLIKFPLFWIGLALMIYMTIQALNPKMEATFRVLYWKLFVVDYVKWLPSGVDAIFGFDAPMGMNAWRMICLFGSAWLMLCALWCGVRTWRVWKVLMYFFVLLACVLAAFGMWRLAHGEFELFGYKGCLFFSTFPYKNHAAQFFLLALAAAVALGFRVWRANMRREKTAGSHFFFAATAIGFLITIFMTGSAGGLAIAIIWIPLLIVLILASDLLNKESMISSAFAGIALIGLVFFWVRTSETSLLQKKFETRLGFKEEKSHVYYATRADFRELSSKMFHYNWETELFGWGAGSYCWIAPRFQMQMKAFTRPLKSNPDYKCFKSRAEYAHCDPWNMLCEWGYLGAGIFFSGVIWFFGYAIWNYRHWSVSSVALFAGTLGFAGHSLVDFVSYNPALLLTLAFLMAAFRADLSRNSRYRHAKIQTQESPKTQNG